MDLDRAAGVLANHSLLRVPVEQPIIFHALRFLRWGRNVRANG